jgi:hypothetical protein
MPEADFAAAGYQADVNQADVNQADVNPLLSCRSPLGTFSECQICGGRLAPEHAHFRCQACGWRDSCCD